MQSHPIITLLSDFGLRDPFVGIMKGVILGYNSHVQIVDLCHEVDWHNVSLSSYHWKSSYKFFPPGTIHLGLVSSGSSVAQRELLAVSENYFYLAPDNGMLTLVSREDPFTAVYEINNPKYRLPTVSPTFHGRDIFAPVAGHLVNGVAPDQFGPRIDDMLLLDIPEAHVGKYSMEGEVVGNDAFGNLFTNIDGEVFVKRSQGKEFSVTVKNWVIETFRYEYSDCNVDVAEIFVLVNSRGQLEIVHSTDRADRQLGAGIGDKVTVLFKSEPLSE